MNQDQWTRAFEHAMRAVDVDNTARLFVRADSDADARAVGLVFSCKRGKVDMQRPLGTPVNRVILPPTYRRPQAW